MKGNNIGHIESKLKEKENPPKRKFTKNKLSVNKKNLCFLFNRTMIILQQIILKTISIRKYKMTKNLLIKRKITLKKRKIFF